MFVILGSRVRNHYPADVFDIISSMNEDCFHLGIKAIIRNQKGEILLLRVNPSELKGYRGEPYWDLPGGRVQKGSSTEETLKRELEEETGITSLQRFKPFSLVLSKMRIPIGTGSVGLILSSYVCDVGDVGEMKLSREHIEAKWFPPKEAAKRLGFKYPPEFLEKLKSL